MRQVVTRRDLSKTNYERHESDKTQRLDQLEADGYLSRIIKYVPTEIVALYLASLNAAKVETGFSLQIHYLLIALCIIITPIYLWRFAKVRKVTQLMLSTLSLLLWIASLGGPAIEGLLTPYHLFNPSVLAMLPILGTFVIAIIEP